jgi:hypothetical protein
MNEKEMVQSVQTAVTRLGTDDEIRAAGLFEPRGHSGSLFAGGMIGGDIGGDLGGGAIGTVGGGLAAQHVHDAASGLPQSMLVGVSDSNVYGFEKHRGHHEAARFVFRVDREGLDVKVHQRVNVRVLELIHTDTGARIELEGSRLPGQHVGDVIHALQS